MAKMWGILARQEGSRGTHGSGALRPLLRAEICPQKKVGHVSAGLGPIM